MIRLCIFLVVSNLSAFSIAQNKGASRTETVNSSKVAMARSTLEFLAAANSDWKQCADCKTYARLAAFSTEKKIKGGDWYLKRWMDIRVDTSAKNLDSALIAFKTIVLKDVTGGKSKAERTKWKTYGVYTGKLDSIISAAKKDLTKKEVKKNRKPPGDKADKHDRSEKGVILGFKSSTLYQVSIVLLTSLLGFCFYKIKKKKSLLIMRAAEIRGLKDASIKQIENYGLLKHDFERSAHELAVLKQDNALLESAFKKEIEKNKPVPVDSLPLVKQTVAHVKSFQPVKKFARYADQGDGFSANELLDEEDSETIFELTINTANQSSFRISDNSSAQKYALSNSAYFLGKTTEYNDFPSLNHSIQTVEPGVLKLLGNKWQIVQPIKIRFS